MILNYTVLTARLVLIGISICSPALLINFIFELQAAWKNCWVFLIKCKIEKTNKHVTSAFQDLRGTCGTLSTFFLCP